MGRQEVVNLSRDGKPVVVYIAAKKKCLTVEAFDDLRGVLAQVETGAQGLTGRSDWRGARTATVEICVLSRSHSGR